jgi:hypothetical protein
MGKCACLLVLLLLLLVALWLRWMLRWPCPSCGRRSGIVEDDVWDRQWRLRCRSCEHHWEERC